jgi:hypothetical protein
MASVKECPPRPVAESSIGVEPKVASDWPFNRNGSQACQSFGREDQRAMLVQWEMNDRVHHQGKPLPEATDLDGDRRFSALPNRGNDFKIECFLHMPLKMISIDVALA